MKHNDFIEDCYHILVAHQYEAEDILKLLKQGKDFFDLAKKYSICSSSRSGGYLGRINIKHLDEDFLLSYSKLKENEISSITRTKFGYHIIYRHMTL